MDYIEYSSRVMVTLKRLELDEKIRGNVVPEQLYHELLDGYGKCYYLAVLILSDIIYWYRPTTLKRDDGQIELKTKYTGELLQNSIPELAEKLNNCSYDQIEYALEYLGNVGLDYKRGSSGRADGEEEENLEQCSLSCFEH